MTSPLEYQAHDIDEFPEVQTSSQLPSSESLDIDLHWTVLCDLFLLLERTATMGAGYHDNRVGEAVSHLARWPIRSWIFLGDRL